MCVTIEDPAPSVREKMRHSYAQVAASPEVAARARAIAVERHRRQVAETGSKAVEDPGADAELSEDVDNLSEGVDIEGGDYMDEGVDNEGGEGVDNPAGGEDDEFNMTDDFVALGPGHGAQLPLAYNCHACTNAFAVHALTLRTLELHDALLCVLAEH